MDLQRVLCVCRALHVVALDSSLWRALAASVDSEEVRFFDFLAMRTGHSNDWRHVAYRQNLVASYRLLTMLPLAFTGYGHTVEDGIQLTEDGLLKLHDQKSETAVPVSLQLTASKEFPGATLQLCSLRCIMSGTYAILNVVLPKNDEEEVEVNDNHVVVYKLEVDRWLKMWQSPLCVDFVSSGGMNKDLGCLEVLPQRFSLDSFSPYFYIKHPSLKSALQRAFSLYNLDDMHAPLKTIDLNEGDEIEHIDQDVSNRLYVVTYRTMHGVGLRHRLLFDSKSNDPYANINVLALDPQKSVVILQSLNPQHCEKPILIAHIDSKGVLKCDSLDIPPAEHYRVQIKENHVAVLTRGPHSPTLFVVPRATPLLVQEIKHPPEEYCTLDHFMLYHDHLVILTKSPIFGHVDLKRLEKTNWYRFSILDEVTAVIRRQANMLQCKTQKESTVIIFDLKKQAYSIRLLTGI